MTDQIDQAWLFLSALWFYSPPSSFPLPPFFFLLLNTYFLLLLLLLLRFLLLLRHCTSVLRGVLQDFETATTELRTSTVTTELQKIQDVYDLVGFPISQPYTRPEKLFEAIRPTRLHEVDWPGVEFALAVYVHAFPNNVFSVWAYVAALSRKPWALVFLIHPSLPPVLLSLIILFIYSSIYRFLISLSSSFQLVRYYAISIFNYKYWK